MTEQHRTEGTTGATRAYKTYETETAEYALVYVTCASLDEAEAIGSAILQERLVACVNILPPVRSLYHWQGKLEHGEEWVFIAKTRHSLLPRLSEAIRAVHSYDVPCIVSLPITGGPVDFLDWIGQETRP